MSGRRKVLLVSFLATIASLPGCGGSGAGENPVEGFLQVAITWPSRGRYVPPYANSLVARLTAGQVNHQVTINRSGDQGYDATSMFPSAIPAGSHVLQVEAFTGLDGTGTKVAAGTRSVEVIAGQTVTVAVSADLQSTIDHLVINGQPLSVLVGEQLQLTGHAEDSSNALLLLPNTAFTWSITQGSSAASITSQGLLTGLSEGTSTVKMAEPGAQVEVTADVQVSNPPDWFVFHKAAPSSPYLLWRMNIDGTGLTQLTSDVGQVGDRHPAVSPDGTKIAFVRMPLGSSGRGNIWVMNANGSGLAQLTTGDADDDPAWSPNGLQLAFSRGNPEQIWKMNSDGTGQVPLTATNYNVQPSWSPDGLRIAFQANPNSQNEDIYVMNADGSGVQRLTDSPGQDGYPCWTRDGRIIFQSEGRMGLYIMDGDGSNQVELIPFGVTVGGVVFEGFYQAAVSFDNSKIVVEAMSSPPGQRELLMFEINGSGGLNLSNSTQASEFHPSFRGLP